MLLSYEEIYNQLRNGALILKTSGTTGIPKEVEHSLDDLKKHVIVSDNHKNDVWGQCYAPGRIAGIQVYLQARLNKNKIIDLYGLQPDEIENKIREQEITHLSATPTFYRMLSNTMISEKVKSVTTGGEILDEYMIGRLKIMFPEAKIINIYATTEHGTLLVSRTNLFDINNKSRFEIHHRELYVDGIPTMDLVEVVAPGIIQFTGRKNEMINVGGHKVNPVKIEQVLLAMEGIKDALVYGRKNSVTGNIVCADLITELEYAEIRKYLRTRIMRYEMPVFMQKVKYIHKTETHKKLRT